MCVFWFSSEFGRNLNTQTNTVCVCVKKFKAFKSNWILVLKKTLKQVPLCPPGSVDTFLFNKAQPTSPNVQSAEHQQIQPRVCVLKWWQISFQLCCVSEWFVLFSPLSLCRRRGLWNCWISCTTPWGSTCPCTGYWLPLLRLPFYELKRRKRSIFLI